MVKYAALLVLAAATAAAVVLIAVQHTFWPILMPLLCSGMLGSLVKKRRDSRE